MKTNGIATHRAKMKQFGSHTEPQSNDTLYIFNATNTSWRLDDAVMIYGNKTKKKNFLKFVWYEMCDQETLSIFYATNAQGYIDMTIFLSVG